MTMPRPPISLFGLMAIALGAGLYWLITTLAGKASAVLAALAGRLTP